MTQTPIDFEILDFEIRGEFIQLHQLLKATGLVHSGGAAHQVIAEGRVTVDGIVELRKRAKLRAGQKVNYQKQDILLRSVSVA